MALDEWVAREKDRMDRFGTYCRKLTESSRLVDWMGEPSSAEWDEMYVAWKDMGEPGP